MNPVNVLLVLTLAAAPRAEAGGLSFATESVQVEALPSAHGERPRFFTAFIKKPVGGRPRRLPSLIVLGGLETGARSLELIEPDLPVVLAAFEYPYAGPRRFQFPRTLVDGPRVKQAVAETPFDVRALHRFLRAQPYADADRVCVVGVSFGAPFALRAAADDPDLKCLVLVHAFADVEGTSADRMRQLWSGRLGPLARPAAWLLSRLMVASLAPPRPEEDAARLRADQRVLMVEAGDDTLIPAASRDLLWRRLQSSGARARRVVMPGEHLLPGSEETIARIVTAVERWLSNEDARVRTLEPLAGKRRPGRAIKRRE
ncbi:MAG: prolyl oligopeptidase family serine peptidase [Elusimicrobia bacterium]|nr:prolyl oligopeptidase family serine peptidase [Elusimicrobiota bacterium]